ncbi:MAG TPA: bifunctional glutamate N-acetyltransferase/amino-acid acetyltransferase ArgJ, partial [Gammaproteobacteria bacterium]|nr:bifunctional glutamate N-acetyltransferase/amino-acid acetyltransferase ArgJ [Gammaproteobacteria bacterium]
PEEPNPVAGVRLSATTAGIYKRQRPDLVLFELCPGSRCAAVFTRNAFCAAPVQIARQHLASTSRSRYLLINAGNANAGTGERGLRDARHACEYLAGEAGCRAEEVLPFSTGVIGEYLPVDRLCRGVDTLLTSLAADNWGPCSRAIMTTDTIAKSVSRRIQTSAGEVTLTGIAKGSGMIKPGMATMLAFIATDAALEDGHMQSLLQAAVGKSFNRITVDGDTSTNDACVLVATGASGIAIRTDDLESTTRFAQGLDAICTTLAQAIVRDGEGATKFLVITVRGGRDSADCLKAAYAIAESPLVKTACHASDPNWGRILAAVGRAGIDDLGIGGVSIHLNGLCIAAAGTRSPAYTEEQGKQAMSRDEIEIAVDLGMGQAVETVWTCDLSAGYVRINADYRT